MLISYETHGKRNVRVVYESHHINMIRKSESGFRKKKSGLRYCRVNVSYNLNIFNMKVNVYIRLAKWNLES